MHHDMTFYGSATIGERGQLVIPAEARKSLSLNPGDRVLVIGHPGQKVMIIATSEHVESMMKHMADGLNLLSNPNDKNDSYK